MRLVFSGFIADDLGAIPLCTMCPDLQALTPRIQNARPGLNSAQNHVVFSRMEPDFKGNLGVFIIYYYLLFFYFYSIFVF